MRLYIICEETLNALSREARCSVCGMGHKYIVISYGGVDVAKVRRQCNGNIKKPLGWTVEFTANTYRHNEHRAQEMEMLQAHGQGKASFPTWRDAIDALSRFFNKQIEIPNINKPEVSKDVVKDVQDTPGVPAVTVLSQTNDTVTLQVGNNKYEYMASPVIIRKFFGMYKFSGIKALNFLKRLADRTTKIG